ncbi:MAG TPA: serine protease, partial [Archangium sp.]|nr:serine protease [Archangium sp.]
MPPRSRPCWYTLVLLLSSMACTAAGGDEDDPRYEESGEPLHQTRSEVVYGTDDREDVYAHPNATLKARAQQSTVALMRPLIINATDPNNVTFASSPLGVVHNLCT